MNGNLIVIDSRLKNISEISAQLLESGEVMILKEDSDGLHAILEYIKNLLIF